MSPRHRVIYTDPGGRGWASVEVMARLLATSLGAEFIQLSTRPSLDRARRALVPLTRRSSSGTCIVVAPQPAHLGSLVTPRALLSGYERVIGWVIDSWLDDRIPRLARHTGHYDQLFVTDLELVESWQETTGTPTHWLPFGSDVLDQPVLTDDRPIDLLRVGRQPDSWSDNDATERDARRMGLSFKAGPTLVPDARTNQAVLMQAMRSSKATLAFTNLVSPAVYTHPTRDYVTGRWTDALASGSTVAGIPPTCAAGEKVLWPEGLLVLPGTSRVAGLETIADFVREWTPDHAHRVRSHALRTLDWRIRFGELARISGLRAATLDSELERWEVAVSASGAT